MGKRFIDTAIWTQNKWFRKLLPKHKVLWFYLISNCDPVGVWEEDMELASFIIKEEYDIDNVLSVFSEQVKVVNGGKKWWLVDFCRFQYGELKENTNNRPHQSYIALLKKHSLYIDYRKTIERDKEQEKDKEKDKEKKKKEEIFILPYGEDFEKAWKEWLEYRQHGKFKKLQRKSLEAQIKKLSDFRDEERAIAMIDNTIEKGYQGLYEGDYKKSESRSWERNSPQYPEGEVITID